MTRNASILRLFVALYPPAETVAALMAALDGLALGPKGRVADDRVHMTIQFIGDTPAREVPEVQESVERAAAGLPAFDIRPIRLATLPDGPRPRLIAAETDAPAPLMELHRRLAHRLARSPRDHDRFRPHMTLHRFKSRPAPIGLALDVMPFRAEHVCLMRSILKPDGAEHMEVSRVALP